MVFLNRPVNLPAKLPLVQKEALSSRCSGKIAAPLPQARGPWCVSCHVRYKATPLMFRDTVVTIDEDLICGAGMIHTRDIIALRIVRIVRFTLRLGALRSGLHRRVILRVHSDSRGPPAVGHRHYV